MGQFSFILINEEQPILVDVRKTVYLLAPGQKWQEDCYEGYGMFGGKDVFHLVAELNRPHECNGDIEHDRMIGIDVVHSETPKYPVRITSDPTANYEDYSGFSADDPDQGWAPESDSEDC